ARGACARRAAGTVVKPDSERTIYEGKVVVLRIERWGDHEREIVVHSGAVTILAVDRDDNVILVRQLREPARRTLLELPPGRCGAPLRSRGPCSTYASLYRSAARDEDRRRQGDQVRRVPRGADAGGCARARATRSRRSRRDGSGRRELVPGRRLQGDRRARRV